MATKKPNRGKTSRYTEEDLIDRSVFDHIKQKSNTKQKTTSKSGSNKVFALFIVIVLVFGMLLFSNNLTTPTPDIDTEPEDAIHEWEADTSYEVDMIVYSSPDCGCCHVYVDYLEDLGYLIELKRVKNMVPLKNQLSIPQDQMSCHTIKYGDYFVEGHVPVDAIRKLNNEAPDIDGIALAGMPLGSPGMSGEKTETFEVMSISQGIAIGVFMSI